MIVVGMDRAERFIVWAGGAVFVASLVVCAWWYLLVLGRSGLGLRAAWLEHLAIDAGLFAVFAVHHTLFARDAVKRAVKALVPDRLLRSSYVWVASLLLIAACVAWQPIGGTVYAFDGAAAIPFIAIELAGIWLIARSVRAIDPLELAGIRGGRASAGEASLQIGGPYAVVRHPLYLGWVLAVFAHPHLTGDRLAFAVISTVYLLAAVPFEERSLADSFGRAYEDYRRRVRWRVIPFVY